MFKNVSRSLKYDSNIFFDLRHIYIYMDTTVDHFTPLALRVRGKKICHGGQIIDQKSKKGWWRGRRERIEKGSRERLEIERKETKGN